jgi:hypothetical protein
VAESIDLEVRAEATGVTAAVPAAWVDQLIGLRLGTRLAWRVPSR